MIDMEDEFLGFIKCAAATPDIQVGNIEFNAKNIIETIESADERGIKVIVFPELSITGCTCGSMFYHQALLQEAMIALDQIAVSTAGTDILCFVGLPFCHKGKLYSVAAAIHNGYVIGLVPSAHPANPIFAKAPKVSSVVILNDENEVPFGTDLIFTHSCDDSIRIAVTVGGDLEHPRGPHIDAVLGRGAKIICNLSSAPATIYSNEEFLNSTSVLSKTLKCGIITACPEFGESTTDLSFIGTKVMGENGEILDFSEDDEMLVSDIDVGYLDYIRRKDTEEPEEVDENVVYWGGELENIEPDREFNKYPFLPEEEMHRDEVCERIFRLQAMGLIKRLEYANLEKCVVGISGGSDSTLVMLVCNEALKLLDLPPENLVAVTMPCFGTSSRTKSNAVVVAEQLKADLRIINIADSVLQHFKDIGHDSKDTSITFENSQARERTQILMDLANKVGGIDVGTEDLSEFVDGWCTFNGDHISMYDVNANIPKTQVRAALDWYARNKTDDKVLKAAIYDVLDCPVTPELLPIENDTIEQKSEDSVGSYALQDFFTYAMLFRGATPKKAMEMAYVTFYPEFSEDEIIHWMDSYTTRLFNQQFKRSVLNDGPSVNEFKVSPRVGFNFPSDMDPYAFKQF